MGRGIYWIWLQNALGARARAAEIISAFPSPEEMYHAGPAAWRMAGVFTPAQAARLENTSLGEAERIAALCEKNAWSVITPDSPDYPELLLQTDDFPLALYCWGDLGRLKGKLHIAVVGTRNPSVHSVDIAGRLSLSLASSGAAIVSGGALGIDSAAHAGALYGKGATTAVLGCGLACRYLMNNYPLRRDIAESGAVITEFPPETPVCARNFPIRNRIISGMCCATVVIEAGERSGSLITANLALEQGRDVFAVPGDVINSSFSGANKLIREGAKPVFSAADILEEYIYRFPGQLREPFDTRPLGSVPPVFDTMKGTVKAAPPPARPPRKNAEAPVKKPLPEGAGSIEAAVYAVLGTEPTHIDDIVRATGLSVSQVGIALTQLELYGVAQLTCGKRYVIT